LSEIEEPPPATVSPGAGASTFLRQAISWPGASYQVPAGHYDEVRGEDGTLRAPWERFAARAGDLGDERLSRVQLQAALRIRENGVTYNYNESAEGGRIRAWTVDALPFLMSSAEWEGLSRGLRQRSRLLEALARDFYGERNTVSEGLVPAALVVGHTGFARSSVGPGVAGGTRLQQLAFDLGRGPDGVWRVIGTRAQGPSGAGYALENRVTVSRLFPDAFRDLHVQRLARFFRTVQARLRDLPGTSRNSHVVLLTPGPYAETYFEHAYLARYLGFTLAEGGDLTVRDDRVWLQTLSGLEPVSAILRRLDDDFCDPLEMRADSTLGVAGLVAAWRAGNVVMSNAFGAGVLESPGLYGFLPPLCQRLLGETLEIPSVATWWCGEKAALADATANFEQRVLKPAFSGARMEPVFLGGVTEAERAAHLERVANRGEAYVLQEKLPLSQVPAWYDGRLEARGVMLRVFLVSDGQGDYRAMPGALARITGHASDIVSGQRGGGSKDTWILSERPVEKFSMLTAGRGAPQIARGPRSLASRAGENLFWFGRYTERTEHLARQLRALLPRLLDSDTLPESLFVPVLTCARRSGLLGSDTADFQPLLPDSAEALSRLAFAGGQGRGIAHDLERSVQAAAAVRDWISLDSWRLVGELSRTLSMRTPPGLADVLLLVDRLIVTLAAVAGLESERMTRDDGWHVVALGRAIERLVTLTASVGEVAASGQSGEPALLEWLLDLCDASVAYRARYRSIPEWPAVMDLLVHDDSNPRSLAWLLSCMADRARRLPAPGADLLQLIDEIEACARRASDARRGELFRVAADPVEFLWRAEGLATALSDALALRYFRHVYEPMRWIVGR
jgi:uncharacterized circularly permuted ATP-grasp superfamily protein/uncharacterized alpha-E superfamily protein